jgi:hypothetical protein
MGPGAHAAVAALTGAAVWATGGGIEGASAAFLVGLFIDADHLLDYGLAEGATIKLDVMASGSYFRKRGKALVVFHSYELIALVVWAVARLGHSACAWGIAAGAVTHLASDVAYYRFTPLCYSLLYRMSQGFRLEAFKASNSRVS